MIGSKFTRVAFISASFLVVFGVSAGELDTPNSFSAGTSAVANEVNENFVAVATAVNDNDARITALQTGAGSTFQAAEAYVFGTSIAIAGAGTLLRSANSVDLRVALSGLDPVAIIIFFAEIFSLFTSIVV